MQWPRSTLSSCQFESYSCLVPSRAIVCSSENHDRQHGKHNSQSLARQIQVNKPIQNITRRFMNTAFGASLSAIVTGKAAWAINSTLPFMGLDMQGIEQQSDIFYPPEFLGVWDVESVLVSIETPQGEGLVPDKQVVERAKREDLNQLCTYKVAFVQNQANRVIADRRFNTAQLMEFYFQDFKFSNRITWDPESPNSLLLAIPGMQSVVTRVLARSQQATESRRFQASEYFQQVFERGENPPKFKSSQCLTVYKWRPAEQAKGGPVIVATQYVADYLPDQEAPVQSIALQGDAAPVVLYTYKMAFKQPSNGLPQTQPIA